ncbi:GNAT family N-acetyltransferase [Halobellus rufus]|uniref:GNAT family N-acetyltransferase n=1 Tax=Halobellus rufus TaxID=1448860 RepID=UPI0006797095|nr:GNAT family N-acetyltransferase [Halobellus rufus]
MELERISLSEWAAALPKRGFEVFHFPEALSVLDDHTSGEMELLGGFKGDRPTALLPVFVRDLPVGRVVTSPPPGMGVPRLGPVVMPASPKRRKREKVNQTFADLVIDELDLTAPTTLFSMVCHSRFGDPRPYSWADFDVGTRFTYRLDLDGGDPETVLADASKSLRREVNDARELDLSVERGGVDDAKRVFEETRDRYAEQGESFPLRWPYVRDLVTALGEHARVYTVRDGDGDFLTGVTVLYSADDAYFWQGGSRTVHEGVAVNSFLHWRVIADVVGDPPADSVRFYDLHGANTERLCRYKSKFGGELVPYHAVDTSGYRMNLAKRVYERFVR